MGCGESTMKPVVVTTASPTSKLSPGLQMQQDALLQSKRSGHATPLITDAELESLKAAKHETGSTTTTTTTTATTSTGELNWADPLIWTGRMQECYDHYARQPDGELIDKKGMIQLAEDCVQSFLTTCTTDLTSKHKGWAETKIQSKVDFLRRQWLPGVTIQDVIDITKYWLAHEMKFRDGGVTKACFFLHFPRCHRQLFSYGGTITIEREQLVQKLNKQAMEKSLKSVKSSMASMKAGGSGEKGHIKNSSMSVRASKKGKTTRRTDSAAGSRNNMFDLDAIADDEGKKSTKKRSNKHSKASQELNTGKMDV